MFKNCSNKTHYFHSKAAVFYASCDPQLSRALSCLRVVLIVEMKQTFNFLNVSKNQGQFYVNNGAFLFRSKINSLSSSLEEASKKVKELTTDCHLKQVELDDLKNSQNQIRTQDHEFIEVFLVYSLDLS